MLYLYLSRGLRIRVDRRRGTFRGDVAGLSAGAVSTLPSATESASVVSGPVAYAEIFHGGVNSVAYGGHLFLVWAVCDVTI